LIIREQLKKFIQTTGAATFKNRRVILALLEPDKSAKVLDMGCGDGSFTKKIGEKVRTRELYGIEIEDELVQLCEPNGVKAYHADLNEPVPLKDENFDVVVANQIFEHLCHTDLFIKEIYRLLKRGGYAIISTPNLATWQNMICLFFGWQFFSTSISDEIIIGNPLQPHYKQKNLGTLMSYHHRVATYRGLKELVQHHGFEVETMIGAGYFPFPAKAARFLSWLDPRHSLCLTLKARKI